MKNLFKIKNLLAVLFIAIVGASCSSDDNTNTNTNPTDNTITAKAVATPDLSILVQALTKAELAETLKGTGPYTVFAPTNAAFTAFLAANSFANLDAVPVALLKQVLLNHVVSGNKTAELLSDNSYLKTSAEYGTTKSNFSMYVAKTTAGAVKLNGVSNVSKPNIVASNGTIHIVDAVIGLPTIVTHAAANPNFSTLLSIVTSTGAPFGNQSAVATALTTNTTPLTVFAPTNAAFTAATTGGGFITSTVTAAQVTKVLQYHVVAGNNLAASLLDNTDLSTIATEPASAVFQKLKVFTSAPLGARLQDKATAPNNISKIIVTDVQCSNGIIHAVDKVLQPSL